MTEIRKATADDIEMLMSIRLEMLRAVNNLAENTEFDSSFKETSKRYFLEGEQTTVIALDGEAVGCATICYITLMPTFDHPTGKRVHIMNVYTKANYRRQGITKEMMRMLIDEAKRRGVTEISLDATTEGRPLYENLGFCATEEGMVITL